MSTLYARFLDAAQAHADRPAVLGDQGTLTYRELAAAAAGIGAALAGTGEPGDRVGLLLDHGVATVAAILGALAAGRCYVPLDPSWPRRRLAHMCAHADVSALLTSPAHAALAAGLSAAPAVLVEGLGLVDGPAEAAGRHPGSESDPAYILYTSGSTGLPKGVVQSHRNVLHGVRNHVTNLRITPADRVSLLTSFSFDMAVTDLYSAILTGAAVVPVDVRRHGLGHLAEALRERGVTVYHSTPTVYRYLVDALRTDGALLPALRVAVLGGEEVTSGDVVAARRLFAPECVLVNGYGATEVSFAVQNHVRPDSEVASGVLPIGYPLPGYEVRLTSPDGTDGGTEGEIEIHSEHLALGYWRDADRTAERFGDGAGGRRVYRTGDLGRLLPDGCLVYLGRRDRQVKVRGHRVELGEVEAHLEALPGVARAIAVPRRDATGTTEVIGYVQPSAGAGGLDATAVRRELVAVLPDYLVPGAIVVGELPLTPTGKVDVLALPEPGSRTSGASVADGPRTPTERVLHAAWVSVLGRPEVGVTDNFLDLGGHSLLLARVQQKVEAELGTRVPLVALLQHPTVRAQAAHLDDRGWSGGDTVTALDVAARRMARRRAQRQQPRQPQQPQRSQRETL